jgi:hypothetical protein
MKSPPSRLPQIREPRPSIEGVAHFVGLFNHYGLMFWECVQILYGLLLIIFLPPDSKSKKQQFNKLTDILTFVDKSQAHPFWVI